MTKIDEFKKEVAKNWHDSPSLEVCLRILDYIYELPEDELEMLTFVSFSNAVGAKEVNEDVVRAVALLANTSIHALDTKLLFVDDDEEEYEIEKITLATARTNGKFIHPVTGEEVEDFEEKIIPYFVPTERLLNLKSRT